MAELKARKLPPGYEDEAAFIKEAVERHQAGVDFDRENRDEGLTDLKFKAGDQWDPSDVTARKGRPCLTINTLPQFCAQVVGDIRINRPAIRVRPAEDADKNLAEIREGLIRSIERDNDAQGVYVQTAENQVACGIGNFRIGLKYATDDGFERDIGMSGIPNAFAVVWDPYSVERTGRDADYVFVDDIMPRKAFEKRWKDEQPSSLEVPMQMVNGWATRDSVRVTEYWLIKTTTVEMVLLEGGQVVESTKVPPGAVEVKRRKVERRTACMYLITGTCILAGPYELPIDRVPVIRVEGWVVNIGDKRVRGGLIRAARDSQRLKNYWRSVSAEMLALAPKAKWLLHESAEGDDDAFRDAHASDDTILPWAGQTKPEMVSPPQINAAVLHEADLNQQDLKDVTGLHDASLGAKSNETSGKAIMARQREGDVATYIYQDNLKAGIQEGGRVVNQLVPVTYDTARTIRVVGEDESSKVQRINDPNDPNNVDINQGKYDIVVEVGPSYSTRRVEASESMMAFVQAVPAAAAVAGDLIAQAQDWPMAEKIGERLKKAMPPQLLEGEEGQEPKQPDPAQMQAMQMQEQMAGFGLAKAKAEVDKAVADARRAEAEADKAEAEAGHAHHDLGFKIGQGEAPEAVNDPQPQPAAAMPPNQPPGPPPALAAPDEAA